MYQSIDPQDSASELQPHAHRLIVRGSVRGLRFPPLCANCGSPSSAAVEVTKVFCKTDFDGPRHYTVLSADVPFCAACTAAHRANEKRPSLLDQVTTSFVGLHILGAIFPALGAAFLVWLALGDMLHGRGTPFGFELGLGAFFALIAWAGAAGVWRENERFRVPPQTDVSKAFDFSGDVAPAFEPARFVCTMRDARFADAFGALNADKLWHADSAASIAERRRSNVLLWIGAAIVVAVAVWSFAKDLFG